MTRQKYKDFSGNECSTYQITPENVELVNFAIKLGKPLVVEGEPGCGKTQLAYAIAEDLGITDGPKIEPVKSTSRANDLLYRYNALGRLQDSQSNNPSQLAKAEDPRNYIELEFLGKAIQQGKPAVILIDEVDKADIDFADDLLHVIENFEFKINEIPEQLEADKDNNEQSLSHWIRGPKDGHKPIVIFTSNHSKPLSKPFLRRCFFLELNFPQNQDMLVNIVEANLRKSSVEVGSISMDDISNELIIAAVENFLQIRHTAKEKNIAKVPATAELIDWIHVLHLDAIKPEQLQTDQTPHWKLLFKTGADLKLQQQALQKK